MTIEHNVVASSRRLTVLIGILFALFLSAGEGQPAQAAHVCSIGEARRLPLGTRVTVDGTVSTPSGAFASSFFDVGFGLQDRGAGIYVSLPIDLRLAPGDRVRVTGDLADSYGLLVLIPDGPEDVERCGHGAPPAPRRVRTGSVGESTEGLLVSVKATIVDGPIRDLPYGYKLFVDDGSGDLQIFVNLETGIDITTLALHQRIAVTGFSSQFEDHYEIDPRSPEDIVVLRR
jgi:hypothetical protein